MGWLMGAGLGGERRDGGIHSYEAAAAAALSARVEVLEYLLEVDPGLVREPLLGWVAYGSEHRPDDRLACLEFRQGAGCQWSAEGEEMLDAARAGCPEVLRYCVGRVRVRPWKQDMELALVNSSLECIQVLYEEGYEPHKSQEP